MDFSIFTFANHAANDGDFAGGLMLEIFRGDLLGPLQLFLGLVSSLRDGTLTLLLRFMSLPGTRVAS